MLVSLALFAKDPFVPAFRFQIAAGKGLTAVFYQGKRIGNLITSKEKNGRYCFLLAADAGPRGRTYRGRETAAKALLAIHKLLTTAKREGWKRDTLIANAWKCRPESVDY
jgi:hypothetical protein